MDALRLIALAGVAVLVACGAGGGHEDSAPAGDIPPLGPDVVGGPAKPVPGGPGGQPAPPAPSTFRCEPGRAGAQGDRTLTLTVGGLERTVLLHVPKSYDPTKGTSLVLGFHGYGGTAAQMKTQTGFDALADARGVIVAYAQGTGIASKGFNGGDCCGKPAWTDETDDLGLALAMNKALSADYCVDPKRVYSAGFSNGGFMSYRFVCEAANVFAAVASVSGVLGTPPDTCKPTRAVPILHVHGTADTTVPYAGGPAAGGLGALAGIVFRSVDETMKTFRARYTCGDAAKPVSEKGDTRCEEWTGCKDGAALELCTVKDGGHQWPGGEATPVGGKTSKDFAASAAVLDFFAAHPMP